MRYHPVTWHKKTFNSRVACILYARSRDLGTSVMLMLCVSLVCLVGLGATLPEALGPRGALGQVAGHPSIQSAFSTCASRARVTINTLLEGISGSSKWLVWEATMLGGAMAPPVKGIQGAIPSNTTLQKRQGPPSGDVAQKDV